MLVIQLFLLLKIRLLLQKLQQLNLLHLNFLVVVILAEYFLFLLLHLYIQILLLHLNHHLNLHYQFLHLVYLHLRHHLLM